MPGLTTLFTPLRPFIGCRRKLDIPKFTLCSKAAALSRESRDFEAVFLLDSGEIYVTQGLEDRFRSERGFEVLAR